MGLGRHRSAARACALIIAVGLLASGSNTVLAVDRVVLVAGDIAGGTATSQEAATAGLVEGHRGLVMTAGDNAYPDGTLRQFQGKYDPTWGRFWGRTRPTPGNHDYRTPAAAGYFEYFGWRAGPRLPNGNGRGYYRFKVGGWLVLALDSEACLRRVGCRRGSPQFRWLAAELAASPARCTLAVWHRPPFSSGRHGDRPALRPLLRLLYRFGAELLVTGHEHDYERFARARPDGTIDREFGIRQFVVGTGGADLLPRGPDAPSHSRVFQSTVHGVLKLTLRDRGYDWEFLPVVEGAFSDRGSGRCHDRP